MIAPTHQGLEHAGDDAFAGPGRTDDQEDLVEVRATRDDVPEKRAGEILTLDIGDLDEASKRARVVSKGGAVEWVHW
jgi:hypothetical protein